MRKNLLLLGELLIIKRRQLSGVTLFECLLYLGLFSCIACASSFIVSHLWQDYIKMSSKQRSALTLYTAYDMLYRDMQSAPNDREKWLLITPTALVWHVEKKDIGWSLYKQFLVRSEGIYQKLSKKWKKKSSCTVAPIKTVKFELEGNQYIERLAILFEDDITSINTTIWLSNKALS